MKISTAINFLRIFHWVLPKGLRGVERRIGSHAAFLKFRHFVLLKTFRDRLERFQQGWGRYTSQRAP
jgi:hypothetical protein